MKSSTVCKVSRNIYEKKHPNEDFDKILLGDLKDLKCKNCGQEFTSLGYFQCHMSSFACKGKGSASVCHLCGKEFQNIAALYNHQMQVHTQEEEVKCNVCGKAFKNKRLASGHYKRNHAYSLACEFCGKNFKNNESLKMHINTMHTEDHEKPFHCDICGKGFGSQQTLKPHRQIHLRTKLYYCRVCEYSCVHVANRNKHERQKHGYFHAKENQRTLNSAR